MPGANTLLEVRGQAGQPLPRALVIQFRGTKLLARGQTDQQGNLSLPTGPGSAEILVRAKDHTGVRKTLSRKAGQVRITLPDREQVSGRVELDGQVPREPIRLQLFSTHGLPWQRHLPASVLAAARSAPDPAFFFRGVHEECETDTAGRFAFSGLPKHWSGKLAFPRKFMAVGGSSGFIPSLGLKRPQTGLLVQLKTLPLAVGRVVDAGREKGVRDVVVDLTARSETGQGAFVGGNTNKEGRFRIPLPPGHWTHLELLLHSKQEGATRRLKRRGDFSQGADLGDLVLAPSRKVSFQTVDEEGHPLAGMVALSGQVSSWNKSSLTGTDGHGSIQAAASVTHLWFGGPGRALVKRRIEASGELRVVLPPAPLLRVHIKGLQGIKPSSLTVVISTKERLAENANPFLLDALAAATGSHAGGFELGEGGGSLSLPLYHGDKILVGWLLAGVPFQVRLVGGLATLDEVGPMALSPGAVRKVILSVPEGKGLSVAGRVEDSDGHAVKHANVTLFAGRGSLPASTDDQGRFFVSPVFVRQVALRVEARRFAPLLIQHQLVGAAGGELHLRLQPGYDITVAVVDREGRPVVTESVRVDLGELGRLSARSRDKGLFELHDLPLGSFSVAGRAAGQTYTLMHDTSIPRCTLEVPAHGSARIRWTLDYELPPGSDPLLVFTPVGNRGRRLARGCTDPGSFHHFPKP